MLSFLHEFSYFIDRTQVSLAKGVLNKQTVAPHWEHTQYVDLSYAQLYINIAASLVAPSTSMSISQPAEKPSGATALFPHTVQDPESREQPIPRTYTVASVKTFYFFFIFSQCSYYITEWTFSNPFIAKKELKCH